jgi:lipopolysaccharide export system ATP-binding protein
MQALEAKTRESYCGKKIVRGVSLQVDLARWSAFWPNGAGKTTTFCMVVGLIRPEQGRVLDGTDIREC